MLDTQVGMQIALAAYNTGRPVIVFSTEGNLLHGVDELKAIVDTQVGLECQVIRPEVSQSQWNESEWPEVFEAARSLWLSERLPSMEKQ